MPALMNRSVYLYDGSYDGFLTAVFEAYARREVPGDIALEENLQTAFGQQTVWIETDEEKALRVERGLSSKIGAPFARKVWTLFLSGDTDKDTKIYRYIRRGLQVGRKIYSDLAHDDVLAVDSMGRLIGGEVHRYHQFLRFSEMEGGVFYAKISPKNRVVPLIIPHFADRYSVQPFLIHDDVHGMVGVFDLHSWQLVETDEITLPDPAAGELEFRRLWKQFYHSVAVMERYNSKCRRSFMPKRYWNNMTEFNFAETPKTRRMDGRDGLSVTG